MKNNLFQQNLVQFGRFCPAAKTKVQEVDASHLEWCHTDKGELNLKKTLGSKTFYYHSPKGAIEEAHNWLNEICPIDIQTLFIFGIGLGYYFDGLEEWLKNNPKRIVIFLEDDLAVVKRFLENPLAEKILNNTQVIFQYFDYPGEKDWGKFRQQFAWMFTSFGGFNWLFTSLKAYQTERPAECSLISNQLRIQLNNFKGYYIDFLIKHHLTLSNFYHNLAYLADNYYIQNLYDKFSQIPFLLCGAGPSLTKHLDLIKTLENKAIILGSATGLNILNRKGIFPHFGLCIDPYDIQESRQLTNFAYETPFFYQNRFYYGALPLIHGPKIYIGSLTYGSLAHWFNQELQLEEFRNVEIGLSTSNVFCNIAGALGGNPIVLSGMDLAYTESTRYAEGVPTHATDTIEKTLEDRRMRPSIPALTVEGQRVFTKLEWIIEAGEFTHFTERYPDISLINATEGGMKIMDISHLPLKQVIEKRMIHSYDLQNWIHAELQLARNPDLTDEKVLLAQEKWFNSAKKVQSHLNKLESDLENQSLIDEMVQEPFYDKFLKTYNSFYSALIEPELKKLEFFPTKYDEEARKKISHEEKKGRYSFIKQYANANLQFLEDSLAAFRKKIGKREKMGKEKTVSPTFSEMGCYRFENNRLILQDPEFDLNIDESFNPPLLTETQKEAHKGSKAILGDFTGQTLLLYPNGKIKGEMFYKENRLHGPSSFYSPEGNLLARSWFYEGNRVGKSWQYFLGGEVYSLRRYKNGLPHGKHEYYYPNGFLKTAINFAEGLLHGEVLLYYSNGKIKRKQHFVAGKLHGQEQMWNEEGVLITEAEYQNNLPHGLSKTWYDNGQLAKEMVFYDDPTNYDISMWNEQGRLILKETNLPSHPFQNMLKKSDELKKSIESISQKMSELKENSSP